MTSSTTDIDALAADAADGDEEAFRLLVRRVHGDLLRWALARTGDPDDADEVVQRALIRMHRGLGSFAGGSRFTSWLYRIVANAAIDLHRSRQVGPERVDPRVVDEEPAASADPLREIHAGRLAAAVRDFFESLPPRQREVLELVDHQGLRAVDVAEALGIEPVSVRGSLLKARRAVRKAMLERYPELLEGYET